MTKSHLGVAPVGNDIEYYKEKVVVSFKSGPW
jgi:hypothetical protein